MKKIHLTLTCLLFAATALFTLASCDKGGAPITNARITAANVAKIQPGMDKSQVDLLLGAPAKTETKDMIIFKKTTATYVEGKESVEVIYKNSEVQEVHSTIGDGSAGATSTTTTTTTTN